MQWWRNIFGLSDSHDEILDTGDKKLTLIIYDVADNKRRYRIHKILKSYGNCVQKSAFECMLNDTGCKVMLNRITKFINEEEDLLRVYQFRGKYSIKCYGSVGELDNDDAYWII